MDADNSYLFTLLDEADSDVLAHFNAFPDGPLLALARAALTADSGGALDV